MTYRCWDKATCLYVVIGAVLVTSCVQRQSNATEPQNNVFSGPSNVFHAHDYSFTGPDEIASAAVRVEIINDGTQPHALQLIKIEQGHTSSELVAALNADPDRIPAWAKLMGGPNAVMPGDQAAAVVDLPSGQYVLICMVPDKRGVPHLTLGMQKELVVRQLSGVPVNEPASDVSIAEREFSFSISRAIKPGKHMIRVSNKGGQQHEALLVHLSPGSTMKEFVAALQPGANSRPPGRNTGGITGLEPDGHAYFPVDLAPGHYGLVCFVKDPLSGAPHFTKGMMIDFDVE